MKIIGVTGSSGSGKTTLCAILNKRKNIKIIDADKISKELVAPGNEYLKAIEEAFGKDILLEDGNLNRKKLANKIYNDEAARKTLNGLTFKYVLEEINRRIREINQDEIDYAIIDAPLLFEADLDQACDKVIVLVADEDLKIERICTRDKVDKETAKKRLKIQKDDEYYISKADYVIKNGRNYDLEKEIDNILIKEKGE